MLASTGRTSLAVAGKKVVAGIRFQTSAESAFGTASWSKCPLGSARGRASSGSTVLGLAPSHWLGCSIEPATDITAFGHTGMVVQETDKRESEVMEVATEMDGAVATGDAAEADGDSPRDGEWSEYTALHSFEGQQGEASQQAHGAPFGSASASARLVRVVRAHLVALGSSALPGRRPATGRPAIASGIHAALRWVAGRWLA